jgi:hypothetical protein
MKINIHEIILDDDIYPRKMKSPKTIEKYTEALRSGAEFPPIELQRINDGEIKTVIIDGYHRWQAHLIAQQQAEPTKDVKGKPFTSFRSAPDLLEQSQDFSQIDFRYWKDEVLDKKENLNILRLRAGELNSSHGDRMSREDYMELAKQIAKDDPDHKISSGEMSKAWHWSDRTVRDWVKDIRASQQAKRNKIIYKLSLLGWSTREIEQIIEVSDTTVTRLLQNGEIAKMKQSISDWLFQGKTVSEAAEKLEIEPILACQKKIRIICTLRGCRPKD